MANRPNVIHRDDRPAVGPCPAPGAGWRLAAMALWALLACLCWHASGAAWAQSADDAAPTFLDEAEWTVVEADTDERWEFPATGPGGGERGTSARLSDHFNTRDLEIRGVTSGYAQPPDRFFPGDRDDDAPPEIDPALGAAGALSAEQPGDFVYSISGGPDEAPLGFTGRSSVRPSYGEDNPHFIPMEDRWRVGFPEWNRAAAGHPIGEDSPYMLGRRIDPYNQNVLKGDYPIVGQHTFLIVTATSHSLLEQRQVPTATTPFESTRRPRQQNFFGNPDQFFYNQDFRLSIELAHGLAAFKPADWRVRVTPVGNFNYLDVEELGVVRPDVRAGTTRHRGDFALEEWFAETKLFDFGPNYDFVSLRAGSQFFTSDFRGFIFSDTNRGARLFGTALSNRDQFNLLFFDQTEKDTNSGLNSFEDRQQNTVILNHYRQDFIFPGYTSELSFHYNSDESDFRFDKNGALVRPDPVGVFQRHSVDAFYLGWAGDGHINRFNISHAFYWVLGHDTLNPQANRAQHINAQMAALELSYDRDWVRFRGSFFWASGDDDIKDSEAEGFDSILDNPNFAGGQFSYWQRQQIKLLGVNLVQRNSLVPDLRSSKTQGQLNFVNPGLLLVNLGMDFDLTPKLRLINNYNFLWFDRTEVLEQFVFQGKIDQFIGADMSLGLEYRPLLNNNLLLQAGVSTLLPGKGFRDLYNDVDRDVKPLAAGFLDVTVTY